MEGIKELYQQEKVPATVLEKGAREHNLLYDNDHFLDYLKEDFHCMDRGKLYNIYRSEADFFRYLSEFTVVHGDKLGAITLLKETAPKLILDYIPPEVKDYYKKGEKDTLLDNLLSGGFAKFRKDGKVIWVECFKEDEVFKYNYIYSYRYDAKPQEIEEDLFDKYKEGKLLGAILEEVLKL